MAVGPGCSPEKNTALRVGINDWPACEFLYLAQEMGYYRDEGLEVRVIEFSSLPDAQRALSRGQINILASTVMDVLQARDHSACSPQIVQVMDCSRGADVILARPGFTNMASLRGARIGVELASLGSYVLARALEQAGLKPEDVKIMPLDQLALDSAFRKGELDAFVTYSPYSTKLLRDHQAATVFSSAEIPGEVVDVIAVEADIVTRRPGDIARFLHAYYRAIAYAQQHPAEAFRIMAGRERLTPEEFRVALTNGIQLLSELDQEAYLRPGGKLATVIDRADHLLRQSGQIKGPDRRSGIFTAVFAGKEGGK